MYIYNVYQRYYSFACDRNNLYLKKFTFHKEQKFIFIKKTSNNN